MIGCLLLALPQPAVAQGFQWPWSQPQKAPPPPPVPREPVFRQPGAVPSPAPVPQPGGGTRSALCLQLEQRLVQESQRGTQSRDLLPKLDADIKQHSRTLQQAQTQLEKQDCYDYFLFSKTLRRTRQCVDLDNQVQQAKRQLSDLDSQRQQMMSSGGRSYQDDIIRELARNNCGAAYQQEARKRDGGGLFSSLWQDEEGGGPGAGNQYGNLPFATYRTLCVRLCDGYYFPVSFSTLPNHFQRDAEACQSKCAAPVELYYHQNPGGAVEQMLALKSQEPYTKLKTAFRYRKEYVQGCSCKQAEYVPQSPMPAEKRADAAGEAVQPVRPAR